MEGGQAEAVCGEQPSLGNWASRLFINARGAPAKERRY